VLRATDMNEKQSDKTKLEAFEMRLWRRTEAD